MKVVFLDNVRGIGRVGDVKEVSDGYARNFLLKRRLAKAATQGTIREAESQKASKLEAVALAHTEAQAVAQRIKGLRITMTGKANPKGTLFAALEADAVAKAVSDAAGLRIASDSIKLDGPLKTLGEHEAVVELAEDISAPVTIEVTAE